MHHILDTSLPSSPSDFPAPDAAATRLRCSGAVSDGFGGIQYDLNSAWRRLPTGAQMNAHLCDHNCTIQVDGVTTGGNYICPASLSLNHGVSRRTLAPAAVILSSISALESGINQARSTFFDEHFGNYCAQFHLPAPIAAAMQSALDQPQIEVNLFGGNPEMHPEILTVIRELRGMGHRVHFTTTGRRFMREPEFVAGLVEHPPTMIALSADDFENAAHIERLAQLNRADLMQEWKKIQWQHGQRQKAYEAMYVAKLAAERGDFPPLLFNMVLHPGNLPHAWGIISALIERFPGVLVNPYPAQSAFLHEEPALQAEHMLMLRDVIEDMLAIQIAAIQAGKKPTPLVPRLHYWLMLRAAFDLAGDDMHRASRLITGEGIWRCYQSSTAGRYLQVGMGTHQQFQPTPTDHPGGHLGCFWNNETVTKNDQKAWHMQPDAVTTYIQVQKPALGRAAPTPCPGCAFPRLTYDMLATETGMSAELLPFYFKRRRETLGF